MSADGSLIFDTGLDNSGFDKGISLLKKAAVASAAAITVAFTTASGAAVNVGSSFTSAMSQVSATMGITRISDDYAMLAEAAKDMGESTKFSASQAGEALNYLALAGYDAEKSISALPTVLDVAAAGGIDLAYASDMITDSMSALGMSMDQLDNFADQLARTSQKSNTSVAQLGEAILTVGGTAKTLNGGVAELNTMLGLIADNGIKGAEGGTALRNIILSLSAPTNTAAKALSELNISAFDSEGKFRDLSTVFGELNTALEPLGDDRKNQILNDIFNKVDLKAVNALLGTSAERFKELSGYINDCDGAASAMAQTMSDNLQGDMDKLKSALEGLGITAFEKFEAPLRTSVQEVTTVIGSLNESLDGELGTKIAEVAEKFGDLAVRAAEFAVDEGLPKLLDGLEWLCDNADELGTAAQTAAAMVIAYKGLTTAASAANAISAFASAASGAAAAQGALNIAISACPWALAITLAVGAGVAIRDFIEDQRDLIGWEGEVKEAYNDTNEELARRIGYLDELNKKDSWSGYKEAADGLAETNNQLEENNKKLAELYNKRKAINIQRDNIHGTWADPEKNAQMESLNAQLDLIEQEIEGLEDQNTVLSALKITQEHIAGQYDEASANAKRAAEEYKQNIIAQNESGMTAAEILSDIKARHNISSDFTGSAEEIMKELSSEWTKLDHEFAIGIISSEEELYNKKSALFAQYGDKDNEEHWKYYEELKNYEKNFYEDSQRLQEENQQKALDDLKKGYKSQLNTVKNGISDILSEYRNAMSEIESNQNDYKNRLLSVGDVFSVSEETDEKGNKSKVYDIADIQEQMKQMQKYHEYIKQLKAQGASMSLISELTSFDFEDGANWGKYLTGLSEAEFANINEFYKARDALADELSQDMFADDKKALNDALMISIDEMLTMLPAEAQEAGKAMFAGIISGMDISSEDMSAKVSEFVNGFTEVYNAALEDMTLENGFSVILGGMNTYQIGKDLARDFAAGFNEELEKNRAEIQVRQTASAPSAAPAAPSGNTQNKPASDPITVETTNIINVEIDSEVVTRKVEKNIKERERRTGS